MATAAGVNALFCLRRASAKDHKWKIKERNMCLSTTFREEDVDKHYKKEEAMSP